MSRSIGDFRCQKIGVIYEPDISVKQFNLNDTCIVLASDGVWEFMDNHRVGEVCSGYYKTKDANRMVDVLMERSA